MSESEAGASKAQSASGSGKATPYDEGSGQEGGTGGDAAPSGNQATEMTEIRIEDAHETGQGQPRAAHAPPGTEIGSGEGSSGGGSWEKAFGGEQPTTCYGKWIEPMMNKGTYSNAATFFIMIVGIILLVTIPEENRHDNSNAHKVIADYILSFGLFGFAGGITNWLAVKMLFDKIPGLYGSGVIPNRFKEIREKIKSVIMDVFFDIEYLERYVSQKANSMMAGLNLEDKINKMLESPEVDQVIDAKLAELGTRPEGMYLSMMGINPASLKPMIKPFVLGMGSDMAPLLIKAFNPLEMINIRKLRDEVDALLETKLLELSPEIVKMMMESVIREHLGWLVVWGNVFGGLIGIVTKAAGYG